MANTTTTKAYSLDEYMSEREKELARAREAAKREADVGIMKLQKYLQPSARTAAQGYSQGLSETAMIAAENSRQRAHAAADAAYTAGYNDLMAQYRTEKKAEQDGLYADVMGIIDGGEWNTTGDLSTYLYGEDGEDDGVGGATEGLTEAQRSVIKQKYGRIAADPEQKSAEVEFENKIVEERMADMGFKLVDGVRLKRGLNGGNGDNFVVSDGENKYKVEVDYKVEGFLLSELKPHRSKIDDGSVFSYKGQLYIRDGDDFYAIRGRGDKSTAGINDLKALFN